MIALDYRPTAPDAPASNRPWVLMRPGDRRLGYQTMRLSDAELDELEQALAEQRERREGEGR